MKKQIKNLTDEELKKICNKYYNFSTLCKNCPLRPTILCLRAIVKEINKKGRANVEKSLCDSFKPCLDQLEIEIEVEENAKEEN